MLAAVATASYTQDYPITAVPLTSMRLADRHGVEIITGKVGDRTITAVPYYAWNNRGRGEMMVWAQSPLDECHVLCDFCELCVSTSAARQRSRVRPL